MEITYTEEKSFSQNQIEELFLSVNWVSGKYPARLFKALKNSSTVITAWDGKAGEKLVGLARVLDDSEMTSYIHYVLVNPKYQEKGIASKIIEMIKEKYRNFLYINVMPGDKNNASCYQKHGFKIMEKGCAMQIVNYGK